MGAAIRIHPPVVQAVAGVDRPPRGQAGGTIGAAELARSAPDGHTIMADAMAHTVNPATPARTLAERIGHVKARPGRLSCGFSGNAMAAHLAAAPFISGAGLDIQHAPCRGGTPALQDLLGGSILFVSGTVSSSLQLAREGRLRPLAVSAAERVASLPDVPTIAGQGLPGFEPNEWNGRYRPAGLPAGAAQLLHEAAKHALADAAVQQRLLREAGIEAG